MSEVKPLTKKQISDRKYFQKHKEEMRAYQKEYYQKHKEKIKARSQTWRQNNYEQYRTSINNYNKKHPDKCHIWSRQYYQRHRKEVLMRQRTTRYKNKIGVLSHYGGTPPKCICCGERNDKFLTIDHVNNDGYSERKKLKHNPIRKTYKYIIENNFPNEFQILCMNCNWGKMMNDGICPHKGDTNDN